MRLFRTTGGAAAEQDGTFYALPGLDWDGLFRQSDPGALVAALIAGAETLPSLESRTVLAPLASQEVWAAGVTYYRSRDARMEESKAGGAEDFYARVYEAERPE